MGFMLYKPTFTSLGGPILYEIPGPHAPWQPPGRRPAPHAYGAPDNSWEGCGACCRNARRVGLRMIPLNLNKVNAMWV